jgi:hypothetical protein
MNFGSVQRLAQDLARQTRGKKVNRGELDGHSGTRSASIPAPPNQQNTTSHDITWNYRNLSFFLSSSSSSRYYTPCTPPKSAHQCKVIPTSDQQQQQGVCHTVALPFTLKSILSRQKKNYGNSNISPCKNILIFKKSSKRNQNPSRYYNSITNLKFQHRSKYHLSKILV